MSICDENLTKIDFLTVLTLSYQAGEQHDNGDFDKVHKGSRNDVIDTCAS